MAARKPPTDRAVVLAALAAGDEDLISSLADHVRAWAEHPPGDGSTEAAIRALRFFDDDQQRRRQTVEFAAKWQAGPPKLKGHATLGRAHFLTMRTALQLCDPAFAKLKYETAVELAKPKRGPVGPAGLAGRWAAACGAFGDSDPEHATKLFRQAMTDGKRQR
jgi:hypothetical protein